MKTTIRHDLTDGALVGTHTREGDDGGSVVAVWFSDDEAQVRIGLRLHTIDQAEALVIAAAEARDALIEELRERDAMYLEEDGAETCILLNRRKSDQDRRGTNRGRRKTDLQQDATAVEYADKVDCEKPLVL